MNKGNEFVTFKMSMNEEKTLEEKIMDDVTYLMENKVESVIGENGLTVWDFAELRDAFIKHHTSELQKRDALLIARIEEKRMTKDFYPLNPMLGARERALEMQAYNQALDDIVTLIKGGQTASLPPQEQQKDILPFKHGEEGTHSACMEMVKKLGDKVTCCTCTNHDCKGEDSKG